MKYLCSFFLLTALTLSSVQAQVKAPSQVSQQFEAQYPNAETPHWEFREGAIVAMFQSEGLLTKAFYERDGRWRETRTRIDLSALPTGISNFIATNYQNADLTYIGRVETAQKTLFRIESEFENSVLIKILDTEGQLLQEEWINYSFMDQEANIPLSVEEDPK